MKSVVKEQMQEINALEAEMQDLKRQLEVRNSVMGGEVPDFMVAQHIGQNKEALQEDLREATEQIEELRKAIEEKKGEIGKMQNSGAPVLDEAQFAGMEPAQRAEAMEKASRQAMVTRMKESARMQNEKKALEGAPPQRPTSSLDPNPPSPVPPTRSSLSRTPARSVQATEWRPQRLWFVWSPHCASCARVI